MKGFATALGAIGLVLLSFLKFCGRIGDDVVSLARHAPTSSLTHVDDLAHTKALMQSTRYADDAISTYPGFVRRGEGLSEALNFVDQEGRSYEEYSAAERDTFWSERQSLANATYVMQSINCRMFLHFKEKEDTAKLNQDFAGWDEAEEWYHEINALNSTKYPLTKPEVIVAVLLKETKLGTDEVSRAQVNVIFQEYFELRESILQQPNGDVQMAEFDNVFLTPVPFVTLETSFERAKEGLEDREE